MRTNKTVRFLQGRMKKSLFLAIELLAIVTVLAIGTSSTAIAYATSNSDDNPGNGDTQPDSATSNSDDNPGNGDTQPDSATSNSDDNPGNGDTQPDSATSNSDDNPGNGDTQPDRVGSHDNEDQTSGEGANPGGTVSDPTIPDEETGGDGSVSANCFGKVISHEAQEHKEDPDEGTLGEHSSDPIPELEGNETPRQGIGNQDQGHPAAHGAFNSQFDDDDAENVEENC
jgi:hypothetical protein